MKIGINNPVQGYDLARELHGNNGTFLCQQGGQTFVCVAAEGHSIKFGPKPVGRRYVELNQSGQPEVWTITKISDTDLSSEFGGDSRQSRSGAQQ